MSASARNTLMEEYIGYAQHRVVVHVMQALATVRSSQHMDDQLAVVAQQLNQPVPDPNELFEVSLSALMASYAGAEMDKARSNVRAMYANTSNREATLELLDPTWMASRPDTPQAAAVKREVDDDDATQQDIDLTHDDDGTQQDGHDDGDDAAVFSSPPARRRRCMPVDRDAAATQTDLPMTTLLSPLVPVQQLLLPDAQTDLRRRAIQQQLLLLIHAHKCQQPAEDPAHPGAPGACRVLHCNTMKGVLQHMAECKDGRNCQYAHCVPSCQIIAHYISCKNPQCPICGPLRRIATVARNNPAEMLHTFSAVLDKLRRFPDAEPFLYPVDYVALGIMDYPTIIKRPMDLQTMGTKLAQGAYRDPWMFCDDFRLIVDNAWTYNKKSSKIYNMATALSKYFDREIAPI